jgi:hypothetical protein
VGVAGRARTILLAIICLLLFMAGIFVGNMTVTTVTKTMTLTTTLREKVTIHTTVTAEPPLLVISRAELFPSCIYENVNPELGLVEDPNCTKNIKAVALILVVKNVGRIPVKVNPAATLLDGFGVDPSPYSVTPDSEIVLEPGSYSKRITAVYIVQNPESFVRFQKEIGTRVSVAYIDEEGKCPKRVEEMVELVPGVWWPGAGS